MSRPFTETAYDTLDRVTSGQVTGFTYDLLGRRTQASFGASSTTSPVYQSTITYTYDDADRLTQIVDSANGTISRTYDDRFDAVAQETTPQGTVSYGYDNANQVTSIAYRDGANNLLGDLTYAYDNAGRRTSMGGSFARTNLPAAMASAVYDANNRVTSWDGASLSHDANGNLLGFQGDSYAWNSRDELVGITGTNTASFAYDALGRRRAKTVAGTARQFLYDGLNPIQELSGTTVTANVLTGLGIDEYLMRSEGSSVEHYLTDALGSTIRLTDGSAAKLVDYTYEPYGKASADAASTNSFQFTGRENDGTGLNYYRARYQSPVLGRFISEDPIGLAGGYNVYAYVRDDPILLSDPLGEDWRKTTIEVMMAIVTWIAGPGEGHKATGRNAIEENKRIENTTQIKSNKPTAAGRGPNPRFPGMKAPSVWGLVPGMVLNVLRRAPL